MMPRGQDRTDWPRCQQNSESSFCAPPRGAEARAVDEDRRVAPLHLEQQELQGQREMHLMNHYDLVLEQ